LLSAGATIAGRVPLTGSTAQEKRGLAKVHARRNRRGMNPTNAQFCGRPSMAAKGLSDQ